jgi:GT2 family glycosyltransferase
MNETRLVSVQVAAANQARDVRLLLDSLEAQDMAEWQATIVDRASHGNVLDGRTPNPDVVVLRNFNDQGFCRAQNQAFALAFSRIPVEELETRLLVIAHADVVFAPDAVRNLVAAFDADPELMVGVVPLRQSKRVVGDDMERVEVETSDALESVGVEFTKARGLRTGLGAKPFAPSDACAVFRASALAEAKFGTGWLDPSLPDTQAVVDLTWRLRLRGAKMAVLSDVRAWHTPHGESRGVLGFWSALGRKERLARQTACLCAKNDLFVNRLAHAPWIFGAWFLRLLQSVLDPVSFVERMKSFSVWVTALREREAVQRVRRVSSREARSWFV